ncbi:CapA family protein [Salisediminibacterium halotolerans]|uniref:Poly-gamma-glutamate synthesis protein (Capsule biosynthesis protein) n=1 Tax=Salisediminibacterium halotolerans TaxID=517425 RepID=A0A1H9QKZ0_9BACI|nr:CapA family protein [Salisediminibacterium haloalkalitolerans]SER60855.1 poly-gamma-glutamate synthesis protein (capsule biosynthesis protein) [Salisediminibacterium haloalkalitolerans]
MDKRITFAAAGDCFITRRLPDKDPRAREIARLLNTADVRFANLETTVHDREGIPSAYSGGTWAMSEPGVLDDLTSYGFNLFNAATNHTLDYSIAGLAATERHMKARAIRYTGAGENLRAAAAPVFHESAGGRTALIACTSTFHPSWRAGDPTATMPGRPGVHPLRYQTVHRVTPETAEHLANAAAETDINADRNLLKKEGFIAADDGPGERIYIGDAVFEAAKTPGTARRVLPEDRERLEKLVAGAKGEADAVLVSIHSHEMAGEDKAAPADFFTEAARAVIDAGADAVIGHGPHILRGIELYAGKPIFYSLGNFIFQNETVPDLPADFFQQYGLPVDTPVSAAFDARSAGGKGLAYNPDVWESVIPVWEMTAGAVTAIRLYPIALGYGEPRSQRGWPKRTHDAGPVEKLKELSAPFGTEITVHADGTGEIVL